MPIKVSIVGCGAVIHNRYKYPLRKLEKRNILNVVGLIDRDIENAKELQKFFPKTWIEEDVEKAIPAFGSILTIIASPPAFHAEHSICAFQNGNHVLCEKPMAITETQCRQMVKSAQNSGLYLAIDMTRRFYPSFLQVKHLIDSGVLGKILSFSYKEGSQYNWPIKTTTSFQRKKGGGGVLFDIGSHVLDTIIWLLGTPKIISYSDDAINDGVESSCIIRVEVAGITGFIHLSWDHELANELHIKGTKAEVVVRLDMINQLRIRKQGKNEKYERMIAQFGFPLSTNKKDRIGIPRNTSDCIYFQIIQMIRAIQGVEKLAVTGEEGQKVISIIAKCYKIAKPIDMSWLPQDQNNIYKRLHWRKKQWIQ